MQYITKSQLTKSLSKYTKDLQENDKALFAEIKSKEIEIQRSNIPDSSKEYGLRLLQGLSHRLENLSKAHETQDLAIDISLIMKKYSENLERINKEYASSMKTFESYFDMEKISMIEKDDIERIRNLVTPIESLITDIPSIKDLELKLVIA